MDGMRPCPLCGSEEIKVYVTGAQGAYRRGVAKCLGCGCRVEAESGGYHDYPHDDPRETYDMANSDARSGVIEKWNRRAERTCGEWRGDPRPDAVGWAAEHEDDELWCEHCDVELDEDWTYCPHCGARIEVTADADR